MNIKLRLAYQFTLIVLGIILFFSALVYYFSYSSQLVKFRQNLLDSARNSATLLINVEEVDSTLLRKIQESTISWEKEEMAVTDSTFKLLYGNNISYLNDSTRLANYSNAENKFFTVQGKDGVLYKHTYDKMKYFVFVMAYDVSRAKNLSDLRRILLWSIIFSLWLSILLSYVFAKRAIKPVANIIKSVKEINPHRLAKRLDEGNRQDELEQLAMTFNQMISDIEAAFKNQEDFVSNASHELRTPLTIMIGESDYILTNERTKETYKKHITEINNDLKKLNNLLTNLLELAQVARNRSITFTFIRLDEIIFNSISLIKGKYPGRKIIPKIIYPENENDLIVSGNEGLLLMTFQNLLDNACKFSESDVLVNFRISENHIYVDISDNGIGIPENEIENIRRPFSRAANAKYIGGSGIGLSLVIKIIELHNAEINIISKINTGTTIELKFNRHLA